MAAGRRRSSRPACSPTRAGAGELLPPRLGLPVVHDEIAQTKPPRRSEVEHHRVEAAVEDDRGVAERTERDRDRGAAQLVVRDLVPDEDLERVGAGLPAPFDRDDRLARIEPFRGLLHRGVAGEVDGRDPVPRGSAGHDLREVHDPILEVGLRKLPGGELPLPARRPREGGEGGEQGGGNEGERGGRPGGWWPVPSRSCGDHDRPRSDVVIACVAQFASVGAGRTRPPRSAGIPARAYGGTTPTARAGRDARAPGRAVRRG